MGEGASAGHQLVDEGNARWRQEIIAAYTDLIKKYKNVK